MLSRLSASLRTSTVRVPVAARTFAASAVVAAKQQGHKQQSSSSSSSARANASFSFRGLAAAAAALIAGSVTVAACERVVEQPKGGNVDYAAVRKAIEDILEKEGYDDGSYGPLLVRLAWHSAGTYDAQKQKFGSDGATMRYSPESNHGANAGLGIARNLLEPIKAQFPGCTYADLYTLAGGVAIEAMGGPKISWRNGRSDAKDESSCPPDGSLPDAAQGAAHVRTVFNRQGFNDREIVALLGAHSLGRCHTDRSGFKGPWTRSPTTFSNEFYRLLLEETWTPKVWSGPAQFENSQSGADLMMLPTDVAMKSDAKMRRYVEAYAADEALFFRDFSRAWTKMMENGVNFDKKTQINLKAA